MTGRIRASLVRWAHCLRPSHRVVDHRRNDILQSVLIKACTCGRVFWVRPDAQLTEVERAAVRLYRLSLEKRAGRS